MEVIIANSETIHKAAKLLQEGHLVGVTTETVYGLAADATNDRAVALIFETKGRPSFNPLIVHVSSLEQAKHYVQFTLLAERLAAAFWPGPLTLVLPRIPDSGISQLVGAGLNTIAVRCPAHPVIRELIEAAGHPLAAPSANPSGWMSPTTAQHVHDGFAQQTEPALILDGGSASVGLESTVVDARGETAIILRPGGLSLEALQTICPAEYVKEKSEISSPGMLAKHYSPKHKIRINATDVDPQEVLLEFGPDTPTGAHHTLNLSPTGDLEKQPLTYSPCSIN